MRESQGLATTNARWSTIYLNKGLAQTTAHSMLCGTWSTTTRTMVPLSSLMGYMFTKIPCSHFYTMFCELLIHGTRDRLLTFPAPKTPLFMVQNIFLVTYLYPYLITLICMFIHNFITLLLLTMINMHLSVLTLCINTHIS
jgi:hypothetical protein